VYKINIAPKIFHQFLYIIVDLFNLAKGKEIVIKMWLQLLN
jgi:hypothetical protein